MDDLVINGGLTIPESELIERFTASRGPGGQNVNKTSSKVELRWNPGTSGVLRESDRRQLLEALRLSKSGDLIVTSERTRDQSRNRDDARDKLAQLVRAALVRPRRRIRTNPARAAIERRLEAKRRRSELKRARRGSD